MGVSNDGDKSMCGIYSKIHSNDVNYIYILAISQNFEALAKLPRLFLAYTKAIKLAK